MTGPQYDRCKTCGEYGWVDVHTCKPLWSVAHDYSPRGQPFTKRPPIQDFTQVHAQDAEEAAEKFAEQSDSNGDYTIVRGTPALLWVASPDGEISKWEVEGEALPRYSGHPAKEPA